MNAKHLIVLHVLICVASATSFKPVLFESDVLASAHLECAFKPCLNVHGERSHRLIHLGQSVHNISLLLLDWPVVVHDAAHAYLTLPGHPRAILEDFLALGFVYQSELLFVGILLCSGLLRKLFVDAQLSHRVKFLYCLIAQCKHFFGDCLIVLKVVHLSTLRNVFHLLELADRLVGYQLFHFVEVRKHFIKVLFVLLDITQKLVFRVLLETSLFIRLAALVILFVLFLALAWQPSPRYEGVLVRKWIFAQVFDNVLLCPLLQIFPQFLLLDGIKGHKRHRIVSEILLDWMQFFVFCRVGHSSSRVVSFLGHLLEAEFAVSHSLLHVIKFGLTIERLIHLFDSASGIPCHKEHVSHFIVNLLELQSVGSFLLRTFLLILSEVILSEVVKLFCLFNELSALVIRLPCGQSLHRVRS